MKKCFFLLAFVPSLGLASAKRVTDYKAASCTLLKGEAVLHESSATSLMLLTVEEHLGRFVQLSWQDGDRAIQYQLLLEDDVTSPAFQSVVVLQNLKVNDREVSAEFSAENVTSVQILNDDYKVRCALPHE